MSHQEIVDGLLQLGFDSGWVISDDEITLWQNTEPQPTKSKIAAAAVLYAQTLQNKAIQKAEAKAALLNRLGITADEALLLLS